MSTQAASELQSTAPCESKADPPFGVSAPSAPHCHKAPEPRDKFRSLTVQFSRESVEELKEAEKGPASLDERKGDGGENAEEFEERAAKPPAFYVESPIRAEIPKKILSEMFSSELAPPKRILEFRRKKVINSEDKKFLELLEAQNYTKNFRGEAQDEQKQVVAKPREESELVKKIRKSAIVRKLNNFWASKTLHYPSVFKKLIRPDAGGPCFECYDLTRHQFDAGGQFDEPESQTN